ncbi:MAG: NAD(P)/FAD-dependent oxidoreductase [Methanomicrobiales archaeon]|nr:NAD(P)/FAD-dependent oxidoreductase [Methanomicrobiales archaeon]
MIPILGGGPAGRLAAMRLAHAGRDVELIEERRIGGQCLHQGCMVICALSDVARLIRTARMLADLQVLDAVPNVSFSRLLRGMQEIQEKIEGVLDAETRGAGVTIRYGSRGSVQGRDVYVNGERVEAEAAIIATGSRPRIPDIPGISLAGVYNPHTLATMERLPSRMAIVGCGIMGVEFAGIFHAFGSEVHLLCRSRFLKTLDPAVRRQAEKELNGVHIREHARIRSIDGDGSVSAVTVEEKGTVERVEVDAVFLAPGLVPRSECVEGIAKGPLGEICVDDRMRTSVEGIYACGDVTGPPYLTPVARMEGIVAADNILGKERRMDYSHIPQSISLGTDLAFSLPRIEADIAASVPAPAGPGSFWSVPSGGTGFAKVMVDAASGRICGAASAAPGAAISLHYLAHLMRQGSTVFDFEEFIETHPTTDGLFSLAKYLSERLRERGSR